MVVINNGNRTVFVSSNSVGNQLVINKQIELLLHGHPILLITVCDYILNWTLLSSITIIYRITHYYTGSCDGIYQ